MSENIIKNAVKDLIRSSKGPLSSIHFILIYGIDFVSKFTIGILGKSGIAADFAGSIFYNTAALKELSDVDFFSLYKKLETAEARELKEELRLMLKNKGKDLEEDLLKEDSEIFKLSFLIKMAFKLELSFNEFIDIAKKAGYTVKTQTSYPPYYFLRYMLERKQWDYYAYREGLTDKDNISVLLREKVLSLQCFNEAAVKDFFQNNADRYRMSFREASDNLQFQVDFIQYFFNAVYICGELGL